MKKHNKILLIALTLTLLASIAFAQSNSSGAQRQLFTHEVMITSNVRNADVYVNGQLQRARTPASLILTRGTYEIRVDARGYLPWSRTLVINSDMNIHAELQLPYAVIRLEVPSEYLNYEVRRPQSLITFYVDGEIRRGPETQVPPGWHEIAVVSGGLRFESEVYLESGSVYSLDLMLRLAMLQTLQMVWR